MKKIKLLMLLFAVALMGYSSALRADDTDIYVDNATTNGKPNVLFVIDTGANFSASAAPCTYANGEVPSLSGTAAGIEQCALVDTINSLPGDGSINIGLLVNNNNNFATDLRATSDPAYHERCQGTYGGCVIRLLTTMDVPGKTSLVSFIKSWKTSGQDSQTDFNVKSGGDRTANMMQEAWAYYNGKIGMSTHNYGTSTLASGCQKNYIILIGNAFGKSGGPADTGLEDPYSGTYGMKAAQTNATSDQLVKISEQATLAPGTCGVPIVNGVSVVNPGTTASDWSSNWADEWARLMFQQDGGASNMEGTQNITTYTIGVVDPGNQCKPDYPALLTTTAKYGGGKYFQTSNSDDLKVAFNTILNEVQAVNSVFSSASLPVSVNSDGSYLNQIYLGMFRPDATAAPRWMGNLKQYHLIKDTTGALVMGDANNQPAISAARTGFISPSAVSFWTKKLDTSTLPDSVGGFWVNDKKGGGGTPSGYDTPDGEVVEKGGVSQQIRLENLEANFSTTEGSSTNPRRLYTYCPTGTPLSCSDDLTDPTNAFSTTNAGIPATAFGTDTTLPIASIVRTGTDQAIVTTSGPHGFSTGTWVSIYNAAQAEYNVYQQVTVTGPNTFTISGLPDSPTSPSQGTYTVTSALTSPVSVISASRSTSTSGGVNTEYVTMTTSAPHGFTTSTPIVVMGANSPLYNFSGNLTSVTSTTFTFPVTIAPTSPAANTYLVQLAPAANPPITGVSLTNPSQGVIQGSTSTNHNLHLNESVIVSNASGGSGSKYPGTYTVSKIIDTNTFQATGGSIKSQSGQTATVAPDTTPQPISSLTRDATTASATATATGLTSGWFGNNSGDAKIVNIIRSAGTSANEGAYVASGVTITCQANCTSFTYSIAVTPPVTDVGTIVAGLGGGQTATLLPNNITRSGATATVTGVPANVFASGQTVTIVGSGTTYPNETGYLGKWQITCTAPCTSFTFGPLALTPASPATGAHMTAYSKGAAPNRNTVIRWVRGEDNFGDEKGPGTLADGTVTGITVRGSVHGDVLHSRPLVINYGDAARGMVVFYGANDGVFRAVNGNQPPKPPATGAIAGPNGSSVQPGGELWGLVFREQYGRYLRQRVNAPELRFPSTTLATAQPKDYFVDGPTAAYQQLDANGTISKAYLYLTMRRGGTFMYALDVSNPAKPTHKWDISNSTPGFEELGQTWSRPRAAVIDGGNRGNNPVLIFGGGYDPAEDSEPPAVDKMGRAIYVVDADTGALIWQASPSCTPSATCLNVPGMKWAIPSDITFVDRDFNGKVDKLYVGDLGGNIWRADIANANPSLWTVTLVAALGCDGGACPWVTINNVAQPGTSPRKFFFPPAVLSIKPSSDPSSYDAISIPSGDREHPLKSSASYNVKDKFFMISDTGTGTTPVTKNVTMTSLPLTSMLFDATSNPYDATAAAAKPNGFFISFNTGEKGVNAPLATNGQVFFGTNQPQDKSKLCAANLGQARAYSVSPFLATTSVNVIDGGGLPPSAVTGLIKIDDPVTGTTSEERFCIGCAASCTGTGCSALENSPPPALIPKNLKRTYWYRK